MLAVLSRTAYDEITRRLLDTDIFEGIVLDTYSDILHEQCGTYIHPTMHPTISEISALIDEEAQCTIETFFNISGIENQEEYQEAYTRWETEVTPMLDGMVLTVLMKHQLQFAEGGREEYFAQRHHTNILPCQNELFKGLVAI